MASGLYRTGTTEIVRASGGTPEQIALAARLEAAKVSTLDAALSGQLGPVVQARTAATVQMVESRKAKTIGTTFSLATLAAAAAYLWGGGAAAPAASAPAASTATMPAAVVPSSAGYTAAAWPSGGTVFSLANPTAAAVQFGASVMNFSDLLRSAGKTALNSMVSGLLTQTGGSNPYYGGAPAPAPAAPVWDFAPGMGPAAAPMAAPGMMTAALPVALPAATGLIGRLFGGAGAMVGAAAGVVRSVGGKILRVILPSGRVVGRKKAVDLAKRVGLEAAAVALGITAVEMAQMVMDDTGTRRRRGGITSSQLRTTRATMGKVKRMHAQIAGYCGSSGYRTRRSSGRGRPAGRGNGGVPLIVNQG